MWQKPKTDWTENDKFNAEDYNRIKGNLEYLKEMYLRYYSDSIEQIEMTEQKVGNEGRVNVFNILYHNLYLLNRDTLNYPDIIDISYKGNDISANYVDWNELESNILKLYQALFYGYISIKQHLSFRLGNVKNFGRRV